MSLRLYDAHNHLQDERFGGRQRELLAACAREGVVRMVVNGSCEEDWPNVLELARRFHSAKKEASGETFNIQHSTSNDEQSCERKPLDVECWTLNVECSPILPSFGYHPWHLHERTPDWLKNLTRFLDAAPSAVGEIGLDRWKPGLPYDGQEEAFVAQLALAAERNLPASIHCLQTWGRMLEILKSERRPARGFLLHSYGGPGEMVKPFADLGAYFSLPGWFAHDRKERQRETFKAVPPDRLLIETDAPDQMLPKSRGWRMEDGGWHRRATIHRLKDEATGQQLNHPANLRAVYEFAAELFGGPVETLAVRVEENFARLFGAA